MAIENQSSGRKSIWLRPESSHTAPRLFAAARKHSADVVFIDQAERLGRRGIELIKSLFEAGIITYASYSWSAFDDLGIEVVMSDKSHEIVETPLLADEDIDALLDALTRANRLGTLAGRSRKSQRTELSNRCGRQLLVAMLEATSGQRFEDKIQRECDELAGDLRGAYAVCALATTNRYELSLEDLLTAISSVTAEGMAIVDRLERQHLLMRSGSRQFVVRHPFIARAVVNHYRTTGELAAAVSRLALVMASKYYSDVDRSPERRLLQRLINHDELAQLIGTVSGVREVYQELEPMLRADPQFFLQRGSYELEPGDIRLAENFLAQAKGMAAGSYLIQTEWAYLLLKRARVSIGDSRRKEWADEGIDTLLDVIERAGVSSPHSYVVLARESVTWTETGVISTEESKLLLTTVRSVLSEGGRHHGANRQFRQARDDVERAYLLLATHA